MSDPELFWHLGHKITKHDTRGSRIIGNRRFRSFFGVSPQVCSLVYNMIFHELDKGSKPEHLLWALMFLKCYRTEHENSAVAGVDEKTFRKWAWMFVKLIANLEVVLWENRFANAADGQNCFVSLDGTDFRVYEPKPFDSKWWSHKFNSAALRYEIGICIRTGYIVWAHGGYPAGQWSDLKISRHAYIHMINPNELTLADLGYRDLKYFILPNERNQHLHKKIMSRHETVNRRIKQFSIMGNRFRHSLHLHPQCFHACVVLTQLSIQSGESLYSVVNIL